MKKDDEQLPGQLSVFDLLNEGQPCDYSWQREIGQMVEFDDGRIGTITKIEPYYTEVLTKDGLLVGTPTTMAPHEPKPKTMQEYIGECKYCMWYGYGLYSPYGNKRDEGTEGYNCQWEMKRPGTRCKNHNMWKPSIDSIPKLCGNCKHSNCFHYQKKEQYKEYDAKAFSDPVEEPNIYCTRDEGSVNRQQPFKEFYSQHFGACLWDRQHEWDTCDAWEKDRDILRED